MFWLFGVIFLDIKDTISKTSKLVSICFFYISQDTSSFMDAVP